MQPGSEVPEPHPRGAPVADVASEAPFALVVVAWISVFSVVLWGMMLLFGWRSRPGATALSRPEPEPTVPAHDIDPDGTDGNDGTLDERR